MGERQSDAADRIRFEALAGLVREMATPALLTDAGKLTGKPRILVANTAVAALTGYELDEMTGRSPLMFTGTDTDVSALDQTKLAAARAALADGVAYQGRTVQRRPDGVYYPVDWAMTPVRDTTGEVEFFLWGQTDISRQASAEQMRDTLFEALNLSEDSVIISSDSGIEFVNEGFRRMSGLSDSDVLGKEQHILGLVTLDPSTLEPLAEVGPAARNLVRSVGRGGGTVYLDIATTVVADRLTGFRRYVHVGKDVTEEVHRRLEERTKAHRDVLTGIYNRRGGEQILEATRAEALASGAAISLIMCDLDHFKLVNDTYGHAVGDRVLVSVSSVLAKNVRAGDSVIRWGGEEFLIVLPGTPTRAAVESAERLRRAVAQEQIENAGAVTVSMGVATALPEEGLASWIARADSALYASKAAGRNRTMLAQPVPR